MFCVESGINSEDIVTFELCHVSEFFEWVSVSVFYINI